jgi:acyl carrier protein
MSIRSTIINEIEQILEAEGNQVGTITEDSALLGLTGLDSLAIAVLVARLEERLGVDPFTESEEAFYPVTVGDFIRIYENARASS